MSSTEVLFERYGPAYRWLATLTAVAATMGVVLSSTIINVAIPDIMGEFGISQIEAQWISSGFLAATTATMLLGAWAEHSFGHRATFVTALTVFSIGSALGGAAHDEHVLILARILQGAAAGILQPMAMVVLFQVFPPDKRGAAMGIYGIGVVLGPALGPWIGGLLMEHFSWRYMFHMLLPFSLGSIVLSWFFLPSRAGKARKRFDWPGVALLCAFLPALLNAMTNGQRQGWSSDAVLLSFAIAAGCFFAFIWWESHTATPMLDLRLFLNVPFTAAWGVGFVQGAGLYGSTYLLPLFVQTIQGLSPSASGLLLMPAGFALALVFPLAGPLADRLRPGPMIALGLVLCATGSWLTAQVDINTSFFDLAWWTALGRIGMALVFPPLSAASLRVLPPELMPQGSGMSNFSRQLGGAFGVNLLAVLLERRTAFHADALAGTQAADNSALAAVLAQIAHGARSIGVPELQQLPLGLWYQGQMIYAEASSLAFRDGFLVIAWVFAAALLPTWLLHRALRGAGRRDARAPQRAPVAGS